jgi:hypothetical protein
MAQVTVISTRRTAYGPARVPFAVEVTPRTRQLVGLGVLQALEALPDEKPARKLRKVETVATTLDPLPTDHEETSP